MTTVLSVPRGFVGSHDSIQRAAINSWVACAEVILFCDDEGVGDAACELGCRWVPDVERDADGRPLLDDVFSRAQQLVPGETLVFANADILVPPGFFDAVAAVSGEEESYLVVAPRLELQLDDASVLEGLTTEQVLRLAMSRADVGPEDALDVFAFPSGQVAWMPRFAVGRAAWDNWMVYDARRRGIPVVDVGVERAVVHLDTEIGYASGKVHHADAATRRSRRLAGWGGAFTRKHATHAFEDGQVQRRHPPIDRTWLRAQAALSPPVRRIVAPVRAALRWRRGSRDEFYSWPPASPDRPEGGPP